ncbi:Eisosome protein 1 [Tolypocladium ophioglossoides CBS 100239]|uniref:Eisosome protein 1 n=1 Tax=Tolypocladium ophioglossoides (strain CBS 100239) TaxID=1163406 RepID=A0A0L0NIK8_TOLOC|nr:Eisosome protein 1 [Tolypocladium ophioglossoides CBS 100239]
MAGALAGAKPDAAAATMAKPPAQPPAVSTAGRLKYASPRSLPSFPSSGLAPDGAAASAAASLGWSNQKPVELWKPDKTSSASAAAILAKDYKMSPAWEPAANSDGHRAAMLAVGSAGAALKSSAKMSSSHSQGTWGNSAATQAFNANRPASAEPTKLSHGSSAATQAFNTNRALSMKKAAEAPATSQLDRSLVAAKGAMSSRHRTIASQSSIGVKDAHAAEASAAASALSGATRAHRASMHAKPPLEDVGAVSVTTMTRNMFTSHPPVKPEADEQTYNERIHQSAVDMAKKMYQRQQKIVDQAKEAHAEGSEAPQPSPYLNLQDAAFKQAQERLAKLHDEHQQSREYQEYYGGSEKSPRRRFTVTNRLRRRSSGSDDMDDRQRSQKIREQMSMFSTKLSQVDKDKREKDREALLAAAQRNVKARLQGMDEKVYRETGRANPTFVSEWEVKAQQAAQSRHESRTENRGKVDIGGGKFMTQEEVDAIATKRVQPVLNVINEKAEAERERQMVLKMDEVARREEGEKQKTREREMRELERKTKGTPNRNYSVDVAFTDNYLAEQERQEEKAKKLQEKQEEKARRDEEKAEERAKKEEEKAAKAEQKRHAKEERRKSKKPEATAVSQGNGEEHAAGGEEGARDEDVHDTSNLSGFRPTVETSVESPGSAQRKTQGPTSPTSKVKGWIKNRFSRGKSAAEHGDKRRSFLGGAAMKESGANGSTASLDNRSTSMRDVAIAGKSGDDHAGHEETRATDADHHKESAGNDHETERDSHGVSPVSTPLEEERHVGDKVEEEDEARNSRMMSMAPPRPIADEVARSSSSPTRDSRFREEIDR